MYLRGDTVYQTLDGDQCVVTTNPLLDSTAHNYKKDHLRINDSKNKFDHATAQSIIYSVPGNQLNFEYLLGLPGKKIIFDTSDYSRDLMARTILCVPQDSRNNYYELINQLGQRYNISLVREVVLDCHKMFTQYYQLLDNSQDFYKINYHTMFNCLDQKIFEIFEYLDVSIDPSRLDHWKTIYNTYRQANQRDFCREVVPVSSKDTAQKTQIFKEILKWRNGLCPRT